MRWSASSAVDWHRRTSTLSAVRTVGMLATSSKFAPSMFVTSRALNSRPCVFVGIDRPAERLPALFDRFFYFGVSRAATYLGVTCEGHLPAGLGRVRRHFDTNGWQLA